jgi:hypothetical protein
MNACEFHMVNALAKLPKGRVIPCGKWGTIYGFPTHMFDSLALYRLQLPGRFFTPVTKEEKEEFAANYSILLRFGQDSRNACDRESRLECFTSPP